MINISFWNIVFTILNLLILFIAFKFFFFKPIAAIIALRQKEANEIYDKAAEKEKEANELAKQYEDKLASTEVEKKQILSEARKSADDQYQKIISDAKKEAKSLQAAAVSEANVEKNKIIASAQKEIADMVVDATTKVVGSKTGAVVDSQLLDEFLGKAGE